MPAAVLFQTDVYLAYCCNVHLLIINISIVFNYMLIFYINSLLSEYSLSESATILLLNVYSSLHASNYI